MCQQTCDNCPLYADSLAGLLDRASNLADRETIVEVSFVGANWPDTGFARGAQAIIYYGDRHVAESGGTILDALGAAVTKAEG